MPKYIQTTVLSLCFFVDMPTSVGIGAPGMRGRGLGSGRSTRMSQLHMRVYRRYARPRLSLRDLNDFTSQNKHGRQRASAFAMSSIRWANSCLSFAKSLRRPSTPSRWGVAGQSTADSCRAGFLQDFEGSLLGDRDGAR